MIGVLIVDDEALFRKVLAIAFGRQAGIEVLGQCADGTEASAAARRLRPDVVLMDLHMPGTCGLQATRALLMAHPTARVIILTASPTKRAISDAADAGASGYLNKGGDLEEVARAIRVVASGGTAWPAGSSPPIIQGPHPHGGQHPRPADSEPRATHPRTRSSVQAADAPTPRRRRWRSTLGG